MKQTIQPNRTTVKQPEPVKSGAYLVCMHALVQVRQDPRILREAYALIQAGYKVIVIDVEDNHARPTEEEVDGLHFRHVVMPGWFIPSRFKPWFLVRAARVIIRSTFKLLQTPADVYHAHDAEALFAAYLAAIIRRKPLIFDAHDMPFASTNITRWRLLHALATFLLRGLMKRCQAVITVSPPVVEALQKHFGGERAVLVRNMPDYQSPLPSNRLREALGLSNEQRIALYQGSLLYDRGIDILVHAAKFTAPNVVIVLMGEGESKTALEALVRQEKVEDKVKLLPAVPYKELLSWTASTDIGLIIYQPRSVNVHMMLPNKLFEYLMAGVPVLASPLTAIVDIVNTYQVGSIIQTLEPEAIGQAINALLTDDNKLARMRANARSASERDLRWDVESNALVKLYEEVV